MDLGENKVLWDHKGFKGFREKLEIEDQLDLRVFKDKLVLSVPWVHKVKKESKVHKDSKESQEIKVKEDRKDLQEIVGRLDRKEIKEK